MNSNLYLIRNINNVVIHGYNWDVFPQKYRKALRCYHKPLYKIDLSHLNADEWFRENQKQFLREFYDYQD
jgi:hypothetical protein